ncbi:MAG: sugar kinase [Deltaproteobacteria bacterium]|nr:sugar kinase [Deltaproteobacteria bacterium]
MQHEVVGVGHATVDTLGVVGGYPSMDTKTELVQFSMQGGGPVATALATLAVLGESTAFIGKISDDDFGVFIRQGLQELGVDTTGLLVEPGRVSPYSFVAVEQGSGRRTIFWTRGDVSPLVEAELPLALLQGARVLHVDGLQMAAQCCAARKARELGVKVVYDAGSPREGMEELIGMTDALVASEHFAAEVAGGGLAESLKRLSARGPETVVITIGEDGSVGMERGETYAVPALDVDVVDTTGAGDVYHGAFIFGMLRGWNLPERMRFASTAASLSCRELGGRAGLPSLEAIQTAMDGLG